MHVTQFASSDVLEAASIPLCQDAFSRSIMIRALKIFFHARRAQIYCPLPQLLYFILLNLLCQPSFVGFSSCPWPYYTERLMRLNDLCVWVLWYLCPKLTLSTRWQRVACWFWFLFVSIAFPNWGPNRKRCLNTWPSRWIRWDEKSLE